MCREEGEGEEMRGEQSREWGADKMMKGARREGGEESRRIGESRGEVLGYLAEFCTWDGPRPPATRAGDWRPPSI